MTGPVPTDDGHLAMAYEKLRSDVLDGPTAGGHFGLVILLREGVCAWMAHDSAKPAALFRVNAKGAPQAQSIISDASRPGTAGPRTNATEAQSFVSDDIHADMVAVFANMVMATAQKECL